MPVTREPTAEITPPGGVPPRSDSWSTSGSSTTRNPSDVGPDPAGPVHDRDQAVIVAAGQAGQLPHRLGHLGGQQAQLSDDLPGLGHGDLRARPDPPDAGRGGHVPVDHLRAAHTPTVRGLGQRFLALTPARTAAGKWASAGAAAAAGQGGSHPGDLGAGLVQGARLEPVGHHGEGEQLAVPGVGDAGQRGDACSGCRSWPGPGPARPGPPRRTRCRPGPASRRSPPPAAR